VLVGGFAIAQRIVPYACGDLISWFGENWRRHRLLCRRRERDAAGNCPFYSFRRVRHKTVYIILSRQTLIYNHISRSAVSLAEICMRVDLNCRPWSSARAGHVHTELSWPRQAREG
jgi:hypothetical protein